MHNLKHNSTQTLHKENYTIAYPKGREHSVVSMLLLLLI